MTFSGHDDSTINIVLGLLLLLLLLLFHSANVGLNAAGTSDISMWHREGPQLQNGTTLHVGTCECVLNRSLYTYNTQYHCCTAAYVLEQYD